jgi:hypothetical protein
MIVVHKSRRGAGGGVVCPSDLISFFWDSSIIIKKKKKNLSNSSNCQNLKMEKRGFVVLLFVVFCYEFKTKNKKSTCV